MAKSKTNILPDEINNLINELEEENKDYKEIIKLEKRKRKKTTWDFPIGVDIEFFDRRYSYEASGYRPIDLDNGLDFDPNWFIEARLTFKKTGHYCLFPRNSKAYADFWTELYLRCRDGYTVNGYTITGDHYFFLNYYQLNNLETAKAGQGRTMDFPSFYVVLYEWFHYLELCKLYRKNAALMKARGVGFSEMDAALAANTYNCRRNSNTVITASLAKYVDDTLSKVWNALTFLNDYTDGGFFKLRQVIDKTDHKKASFYKNVNGQKVESGWMSLIKGIIADVPNKIRGDRADLLIYEEGGSWNNSTKAFIQGDALIGILGMTFGLKVIGGTGGDSGPALEGLRTIYYKPKSFNVLPFRHSYTLTGEEILSGFFIPAFAVVKGEAMDHRGFTDPEKGKEYYDERRLTYIDSPQDLITYSAEYCYNAEEAFNLEGDNKFNKIKIAEQLAKIKISKICPTIDIGHLEYTFKEGKHIKENINGFKWIPNKGGKILILEHPIWSSNSKVNIDGELEKSYDSEINNLYVAGIDSIDIGSSDTSSQTRSPSDFCVVIKKRAFGLNEPQYVAIYKDRPSDIREAYKIAIRLCQYYNALINLEATRVSILSWARDHGYINMFMRRPRAASSNMLDRSNKYGTPATPVIINHQTDLIANFVNDYCHNIWFVEMLEELNRYTDANKTKFDIIASLGMAELADEELSGVVPKLTLVLQESYLDIGYYFDENGYRRYGIIPNGNRFATRYNYNNLLNDESANKTSDPRYR